MRGQHCPGTFLAVAGGREPKVPLNACFSRFTLHLYLLPSPSSPHFCCCCLNSAILESEPTQISSPGVRFWRDAGSQGPGIQGAVRSSSVLPLVRAQRDHWRKCGGEVGVKVWLLETVQARHHQQGSAMLSAWGSHRPGPKHPQGLGADLCSCLPSVVIYY